MRRVAMVLALTVLLAACSHSRQVHRKSNLMAYLYPEASVPPPTNPAGARLQLPLRVGVAFVPPDPPQARWTPAVQTILPPDGEKRLVEIVRKSFQGRDWVNQIVTIPSAYLVPRGGFENLQ